MRKCQGRLQNESLRKQVLLGLNVFKDVCSIRANEFMGKTSSWRTPPRGVRGWSITPPTPQTWPGYPLWLPMTWAAWISEALALPLPLWATLMLSAWSPHPAKDPRGWGYVWDFLVAPFHQGLSRCPGDTRHIVYIFFKLTTLTNIQTNNSHYGEQYAAAAAAKSLQSCPTLCNPRDGSPPGSPVPGILQARTLEWVAISLSNAWKWKGKVKSLSHVQLLVTPWTVAHQAPPSLGFSRQEYWSGVPLPSPMENSMEDL